MKKSSLVSTVVIGTIGILVGIMFAFLANVALTVICIICGILTLLSGIPQLVGAVSGLMKKEKMTVESVAMVVPAVLAGRVSCGAAGAQAVSKIQITSTKDNFFKIVICNLV